MLFDTHFHLDLFEDNLTLLQRIEQMKIYTIAVTNLPKLFPHTEKLCAGLKYVKPALGFHPELASQYMSQLPMFSELIDRTKYIGEIGLDNLRKSPQDFEAQEKVFGSVLQVSAERGDKVLTIHSRRAERQVISMIGKDFPGKIILHWFSGSIKELEIAISQGFYFSVNYNMTQTANGSKIIDALPMERILLETDGPFTMLDNTPFTPLKAGIIIEKILKIKKGPQDFKTTDRSLLYLNFKNFLSAS